MSLFDVFKAKSGLDAVSGDLLIHEDAVYQCRNERDWVALCKATQADLEDDKALVFEIGDAFLTADLPHMLAFLRAAANGDPRQSQEDFVKVVIKLFKSAGWIPTRGDVESTPGHVMAYSKGGFEEYLTPNAFQVLEQLRNTELSGMLEIQKQGKEFAFLNPAAYERIEISINEKGTPPLPPV